MRIFLTGAAGFIGSNLADRLLSAGHNVVGFDNLSSGQIEFLRQALSLPNFRLENGDVLDADRLTRAMSGCDFVFHLAANADVRFGLDDPRKDLEQNTIATWNVLEAMRTHGIKRIAFSSTGSIYGEPAVFPTPEGAPFPIQTSLYGASKLAGEGLITAYAEGFGMQAYIFRFVSILGDRYTHGHVFDFYKQLKAHPDRLDILGNGRQRKSYLHVHDCISAMLTALEKARERVNIFNLGTAEFCTVNESIAWISECLRLQPELCYSGGERGWVGDSPFIFLECTRIRSLGWAPRFSIRESVVQTVRFLQDNEWIFARRASR
ncbi:MAG TPA: NAD-dependent epimerase/dehydratase family protein [Bryobacteraceae bacterium]